MVKMKEKYLSHSKKETTTRQLNSSQYVLHVAEKWGKVFKRM